MKTKILALCFCILLLPLMGCGGITLNPPEEAPKEEGDSPAQRPPADDGALTVKLTLKNTGQPTYNVYFVPAGMSEKGKALFPHNWLGPFPLDTNGELTFNPHADILLPMVSYVRGLALDGETVFVEVIAARLEDTHMRNPLNPPVRLDIPMDGSPVDLLSSQITLEVTDSSLYQLYGELYEEVGLLVKLVHQGADTEGRSAVIHYYDTGAKMEHRVGGRLGNPPDYLIPVLFAEDAKKVREGTLVIYADGEARSEPLRLTFDENGHCEQGRFLVVEVR